MILVVGASGRLGTQVTQRLLEQGSPVRVMSRDASRVHDLVRRGAQPIVADLRDAPSLARACEGVTKIVLAAHAFDGTGDNTVDQVDDEGNGRMIDIARGVGVEHCVFTSAYGVRPDHPIDFFRIKARVEAHLRASGLSYTILRPSAFMEFWAALVGQPLVDTGRTMVFGRGVNPVNFVSVADVAQFVLIALDDPAARNQIIDVGGPENLTLRQVVDVFARVTGRPARRRHVPRWLMRVMSAALRPVNPALSRQIAAGVHMDTQDHTLDMTETLRRFPVSLSRLEDVVRAHHGDVPKA